MSCPVLIAKRCFRVAVLITCRDQALNRRVANRLIIGVVVAGVLNLFTGAAGCRKLLLVAFPALGQLICFRDRSPVVIVVAVAAFVAIDTAV